MMKVEDMEQQGRNSLDWGWTWSKLKTWKNLEDSLQEYRTFVLARIWFVIIYLFFSIMLDLSLSYYMIMIE